MDRTQLLTEILGFEGAGALEKAAQKSDVLTNAIIPRAILSWINVNSDYNGSIPGLEGSSCIFKKNEDGMLDGKIQYKDQEYEFENATKVHVAACIKVAIGDNTQLDDRISSNDLIKLGKSIDLLTKAHHITLKKAGMDSPGNSAQPIAPTAPINAIPPIGEQSANNVTASKQKVKNNAPPAPKPNVAKVKIPSLPGLKVSKSESEHKCTICASAQFSGNTFVGCGCWKPLIKSAKSETRPDGFIITFGEGWNWTNLSQFIKSIRD